jgi:hypothetical protein
MLRPSKHTELDQTVLAVSATILRHMRKTKVESYEEVRGLVRERSLTNDSLFVPALSFLFMIGLIDYRPKADIIEYVGPR